MSDHRLEASIEALHLRVDDLPPDVAREIRAVQVQDPDLLRRILLYGMMHKVVFEALSESWGG
jgi:hypothetical protein